MNYYIEIDNAKTSCDINLLYWEDNNYVTGAIASYLIENPLTPDCVLEDIYCRSSSYWVGDEAIKEIRKRSNKFLNVFKPKCTRSCKGKEGYCKISNSANGSCDVEEVLDDKTDEIQEIKNEDELRIKKKNDNKKSIEKFLADDNEIIVINFPSNR